MKISYGSVISLAFRMEATVRLADDPLYKNEDLGLKIWLIPLLLRVAKFLGVNTLKSSDFRSLTFLAIWWI